MKKKDCFKCGMKKGLEEFYKHPQMADGHLGKCKDCTKVDVKKGTVEKTCLVCAKPFMALPAEIKRGGGKVCSRECYYKHQKMTRPRDAESWAWKGDEVGKAALHNWVERKLGKPRKCEHCGTEEASHYDWANKSQEYKRDLTDWMRLCRKCHAKYDYPIRIEKWKKAVKTIGWNPK